MRIHHFILASVLAAAAPIAGASQFKLQVRDHALPGAVSDFRLGGSCQATNSFVFPPEDCGYGPSPWSTSLIGTSTDKTVSLLVDGLADNPDAVAYDRYVVFREAGSNPAAVDDVLRVRFTGSALTIDFVSGAVAVDYINTVLVPSSSLLLTSVVNGINEEIMFGAGESLTPNSINVGNLFGFGTATGPWFDNEPVLSVIPTAVPEPATAYLAGALAVAIAGTSRLGRRATARRPG